MITCLKIGQIGPSGFKLVKLVFDPNSSTYGKPLELGHATSAGDLQVNAGNLPENTCSSRLYFSHGSSQIQV